MNLLVVEDDQRTATLLARGLREATHRVDVVSTGEAACDEAPAHPYDAVVLDVMLPGIDGVETCRRLRAREVRAPILLLSARSALDDRVAGLDAGADDYLTKPYHLDELLARLRAFERRALPVSDGLLRAGAMWFRPRDLQAGRGDRVLTLSPRQGAVLEVLMDHPGQILTRSAIADAAWDGTLDLASNVVDVHVAALRRLLRSLEGPTIATVRGLGYRLEVGGP